MSAETSAVRAMRRAADALVARDVAGYADVIDEDYVYEDRRTGLQTSHGKGKDLEQARVIVDFDIEHYDLEVLETRGDLTALYRQTWRL